MYALDIGRQTPGQRAGDVRFREIPPDFRRCAAVYTGEQFRCANRLWREEGVRKSELARRLGWQMPQVDRLVDLSHASQFDRIEAAFHILRQRIYV